MVDGVMSGPDLALEVHAREELGVDPDALLGARPGRRPAASFLTFAFGALLPLLPWFFTSGTTAILLSVAIGAVASLVVGAILGIFTGRSRLRSALRQLVDGEAIAAGVTYGVGRAIGTTIS